MTEHRGAEAARRRGGEAARRRAGERLTSAEDTEMKPLQSLARGLRQDFDAVTAGLTLEWSSGKV
ncbi:hypothetical protein ABZ848_35530 [Streptomyces sp. NPDC047081]|uniref:hypothetical protein n=1 Tax=Streptomyces sp. NPDC047081 TaxID=3154706 RepID=UPI0033C823B8